MRIIKNALVLFKDSILFSFFKRVDGSPELMFSVFYINKLVGTVPASVHRVDE